MKKYFLGSNFLLAGFFATSVVAEEISIPEANPNWFSIGPRFGLNINGRFKHLGNATSQPGPATGGSTDRTYDDGYVKADSSGNSGGLTWNWGYNNASQVQGDNLAFHSTSSSKNGQLENDGDPQLGFDLAYGRRLGKILNGSWGMEAAFDFTTTSIRDNRSLNGNGTLITDTYPLGGTMPDQPPYFGSFNGPGALIGSNPNRTTSADPFVVDGRRKLDATLYSLRLGPYLEFPIVKRLSARLTGGLALAMADSKFSFHDTIIFDSGRSANRSGSSSGTDFLVGGYFGGELSYAITSRVDLFAGAQYEYLGAFSRSAAGEQAQLDLSAGVYVNVGARFNF